ncbi:MAG: hypothetical protein V9F03_05715 [Microthrixaceae bacterium]
MYFAGADDHGVSPDMADPPAKKVPAGAAIALGIAVFATLWLGIVPDTVTSVANEAVARLVAFQG